MQVNDLITGHYYLQQMLVPYCTETAYMSSVLHLLFSTFQVVKFQVLTSASMMVFACWGNTLCSVMEVDWCFRGA
jgi:hypothetical protein